MKNQTLKNELDFLNKTIICLYELDKKLDDNGSEYPIDEEIELEVYKGSIDSLLRLCIQLREGIVDVLNSENEGE